MGKLGDTLRERRTSIGLSLDQAQEATRIRASLLRALEEGDYAKLPNPGYVRGYISSYARYLELDPLPLLAMYKAETGSGRYHEINLPQIDEAVAPRLQQHALPVRTAVIAVLVLAVLSGVAWGVWRFTHQSEQVLPEPATLTEPTSTPSAEESEAVVPDTQDADSQGADTGGTGDETGSSTELQPFTVEVSVDADGASWLEIDIDGKNAYAGTLAGGQKKEFEAAESAKILVGRPSAVTIRRDGKKVKIPDNNGGTPTVELEAETAE